MYDNPRNTNIKSQWLVIYVERNTLTNITWIGTKSNTTASQTKSISSMIRMKATISVRYVGRIILTVII